VIGTSGDRDIVKSEKQNLTADERWSARFWGSISAIFGNLAFLAIAWSAPIRV